jgi:hypothetical protein
MCKKTSSRYAGHRRDIYEIFTTAFYPSFKTLKGDERILGDSDFVEAVLEAQNEKLERRYRLEA